MQQFLDWEKKEYSQKFKSIKNSVNFNCQMPNLQFREQKQDFSKEKKNITKQSVKSKTLLDYLLYLVNSIKLLGIFLFGVLKLCWKIFIKMVKSSVLFILHLVHQKIDYYFSDFSFLEFIKESTKKLQGMQEKIPQKIYTCINLTKLRERKKKSLLIFSSKSQKKDKKQQKNQQNVKKNQISPSNQVLCLLKKGNKKVTITYYVPVFLRVLLKNFTSIDLEKLEAQVNASIIITFVYGNKDKIKLPKQVAIRLNDEVVLNFDRDQPLRLNSRDSDHISVKQEQNKSYITFTIRRKFRMKIESEVMFTPFENLDLLLPITIQQLIPKTIQQTSDIFKDPNQVEKDTVYQAGIKFNFMDNQSTFVKMDFKDQTSFGYYSLIQSGLEAKYSDKKIKSRQEQEKQKQQKLKKENKAKKTQKQIQYKEFLIKKTSCQLSKEKLQKQLIKLRQKNCDQKKNDLEKQASSKKNQKEPGNFQYSCFKIPIYKQPLTSLLQIFLPLWTLALFNLGIFFQDGGLSDRIGSIAGVMIAFMALLPEIRSKIPPNPKVVFVQYLVYLQILASLLCLIDSINIRAEQDYHMVWYKNIFFLLALVIFITEVAVITILSVSFWVISVHAYELSDEQLELKNDKSRNKFNHLMWVNKDCDKKFQKIIKQTNEISTKMKSDWQLKLSDLKETIQTERKYIENDKCSLLNSKSKIGTFQNSQTKIFLKATQNKDINQFQLPSIKSIRDQNQLTNFLRTNINPISEELPLSSKIDKKQQ